MSMNYWPIVGYGVQIPEDMFDMNKINSFFAELDDSDCYSNCFIESILNIKTENTPYMWMSSGDLYNEVFYYIILEAVIPTEQVVKRDPDVIEKEIVALISPFLKNNDDFVLKADVYYEIGCSM